MDAKIEALPVRPEAITPFDPSALHDKLEFMVGSAVGEVFHALIRIRSGFWTFVDVSDRRNRTGTA
jgi:hypothetical protein